MSGKTISIASLNHQLSKLKKYVYDDEKDKALELLDDMNKQLKADSDYYCERCNKALSNDEYRMSGELCESCCYELGCHQNA